MTESRVPTLGESVTEATVATWFKKTGEAVAVDEMLCELETDKVTVEVPSTVAGVLWAIMSPLRARHVGVDALLANVKEGAAGTRTGSTTGTSPGHDRGRRRRRPPPRRRKMSKMPLLPRKRWPRPGIDPATVTGTGRDSRIMKEDVAKARQRGAGTRHRTGPRCPAPPVAADDDRPRGSGSR